MQPLVSVIMPAYNAEKYIADSIQSVLDQTYSNWELVVVDDGSTDKTADITKQFLARDSRIKYVFQENGRLGKARNTGVENSTGSLIAFLDSDDLWLPEKLQRQVQALVEEGADIVYSNGFIFYDPGPASGPTEFSVVSGRVEGSKMFDSLLLENNIPVLSVLLRSEVFQNVGPFEESLPYHGCEDYDLWLKVAARGAVFYGMTDKLVRYRRHNLAMTHKQSKVLKPMLRVINRHIDAGGLTENQKRTRLRSLYRQLIGALIEEGELGEAKEFLKEFATWDKSGIVTSLQKLLMKISPRGFNVISRECLYRAEWHLGKLTGK
ncbi:MAG TPA: glycosyltransferase family A protein [Pyrinomonadaceae bacterium]|nr:glycosyltransferase family A protein [Pyrinomonadaceae bacterium]